EGKDVKLIDLVNLVRPVPTQRNATALQQLVAGTLRNTATWEAKLSQAGEDETDKAAAKATAWTELLRTGKLGYMALLRNLRNLLETDLAEDDFALLLAQLTDERAIRRSLQFPFRFLSAYAEVEKLKRNESGNNQRSKPLRFLSRVRVEEQSWEKQTRVQRVLEALELAVNVSVKNLPELTGKTAILTDNSGSMRGDSGGSSAVAAMSKRTTADIANLFAVLFRQRCEKTYIGLFGDRLVDGDFNPRGGVFENFSRINRRGGTCGPGTETGIFHFFERLLAQKEMVDRIVIFSDMQIGKRCSWYTNEGRRGSDFMALYERYRKLNPAVRVYSVDLRGYGTTVFKNGEYKIAGWSDKIFEIMDRCEQDPRAMLTAIRSVEL
ncbi:MAG: TROVE domain-containing protein, partial [Bacteroidota bacterium]